MEDSIFWVDVEKINPNPYQPRREFDEARLRDLADSIKQYGILQPLVVTREEVEKEDGGIMTTYELIAGERRLRAAKLAGLSQVPVVIRTGDPEAERDRIKLELAIIENVQREDLNPIDRARAFKRLVEEFNFKHSHIAQKIGKSREYVSNSVRLLALPQELIDGLVEKKITEGHARPLLMLVDHPEEQSTLFKEILLKKLSVREAERIARHTAQDKIRKRKSEFTPEIFELERKFMEHLGTRVSIQEREVGGGKLMIDFLTIDDLRALFLRFQSEKEEGEPGEEERGAEEVSESLDEIVQNDVPEAEIPAGGENKETEDDLYSIKNFTI